MTDYRELKRRAEKARASALPVQFRNTARRALVAWIDAAAGHGMPVREALRHLRYGAAAVESGRAALEGQLSDPSGPVTQAACAKGCAFCCILSGADGGTISGGEAARLTQALRPLAGEPDGRDWHPQACPALDPVARECRVYEARPMICRSYISPDVAACESVSRGEAVAGPGVLGGHALYLSVLILTREALKGLAAVPTYSLVRIAAEAVRQSAADDPMNAARHAPRELPDEMARHKAALKS